MINLLNEIEILLNKYNSLNIPQAIDWGKYNHYSIVHHSTSIEGSSLTEEETQLLLDENITAKGKPIEHHHMQKDHYNALLFILDAAENKKKVSVDFLKEITGLVMHAGNTRFVDFSKVPDLMDKFCKELNEKLVSIKDSRDALITSFDAHFNLVSIHPFADGNGRVSRFVMNCVQHYHKLPLSNVFKEDKAEYYKALIDTRASENMDIFRIFMLNQYKKMLDMEIQRVLNSQNEHVIKKDNKSGLGMGMMF
jgi:Fic family protein